MELGQILAIAHELNRRFRDGDDPFQIMTRILEECGELAQQVNHFEGKGVKKEKYGEPDKNKLAKEVQDVIRGALQIAIYYGIEEELVESLESSYRALQKEGYIGS